MCVLSHTVMCPPLLVTGFQEQYDSGCDTKGPQIVIIHINVNLCLTQNKSKSQSKSV